MENTLASPMTHASGGQSSAPTFFSASRLVGCTPFAVLCVLRLKASSGTFAGLPGQWALGAGFAVTRYASRAGVLKVDQGRVWITFAVQSCIKAGLPRSGDYFLSRGESLVLEAGEAVLIEPFGIGHTPEAQFSWEPLWVSRPYKAPEREQRRAEIAQPLADLRHAVGLAADASGRLAGGLGSRLAAGLSLVAAGPARNLPPATSTSCAFTAKSGENCVHCSIS